MKSRALAGCGLGGCLIPGILFVACGLLLNDTGGWLLWPLCSVALGFVGFLVGLALDLSYRNDQGNEAAGEPESRVNGVAGPAYKEPRRRQ